MSYDLNFWRYTDEHNHSLDHQTVYEKLSHGDQVAGLESLPIDEILQDIRKVFVKWQVQEDDLAFESPQNKGVFTVFTTPQFVRFDCHGMGGDDMNQMIDIMDKYDCPLYDPQVPQRYDGHGGNKE